VNQNYEELVKWGVPDVGRLYDTYNEPNIVTCATVQSIHKIEKLLPYIKVLIVDEIHEMMSKEPRAAYNKLKSACVRVAVSATPFKDGGKDKCQKYAVKGYFGPILKTTSTAAVDGILKTKLLQQRGRLSEADATFFNIYEPQLPYAIYQDAVTQGIANNWGFHEIVTRLAHKQVGRSVILVERLSHGDTLKQMMPEALWVQGKDNQDTRKEVISQLQVAKGNVVAIATTGIFNTGVNFYVHNLINAAGGQAEHVIIQRFGRGLRAVDDKDMLHYYDFFFHINEYLEDHSESRVAILTKEGHKVEVKDVDF
jgi:superfamily II DNA or RNA helicase